MSCSGMRRGPRSSMRRAWRGQGHRCHFRQPVRIGAAGPPRAPYGPYDPGIIRTHDMASAKGLCGGWRNHVLPGQSRRRTWTIRAPSSGSWCGTAGDRGPHRACPLHPPTPPGMGPIRTRPGRSGPIDIALRTPVQACQRRLPIPRSTRARSLGPQGPRSKGPRRLPATGKVGRTGSPLALTASMSSSGVTGGSTPVPGVASGSTSSGTSGAGGGTDA